MPALRRGSYRRTLQTKNKLHFDTRYGKKQKEQVVLAIWKTFKKKKSFFFSSFCLSRKKVDHRSWSDHYKLQHQMWKSVAMSMRFSVRKVESPGRNSISPNGLHSGRSTSWYLLRAQNTGYVFQTLTFSNKCFWDYWMSQTKLVPYISRLKQKS